MGRRIQHHQAAPPALLQAASDALDRYDEDYSEADLNEALARLHHEATENFDAIHTKGPYAVAEGYLVYAIPVDAWCRLCDSLEIYEDARKWSFRTELLCAVRIAAKDPCEPEQDVRDAITDKNRPFVVQAPWE